MRFKEITDKKKQVTAVDLEALVTDELRDETAGYELEWFDVEASSRRPPHATVGVRTPDGEETVGSFTGDGPVERSSTRSTAPPPGYQRRAALLAERQRGRRPLGCA